MSNILAPIAFVFLILIIYLINKIQLDRQKFNSRVKILEEFIVHLTQEQKLQNNQLQLSEELKQKLVSINTTLNKDIYEMNFNLFEELYPRK